MPYRKLFVFCKIIICIDNAFIHPYSASNMEFWIQYGHVVAFYAIVILSLIYYRKKFDWQGIVGLLRTNWGVAWMERFGEKHARWIIPVANAGIYVCFIAMLLIVGMLLFGLYELIMHPDAPAMLTPVLPGVKIPGSPITFPLFKTLIALFVVIVIHEGSHGIVAAAHKLKVKSSGLLVLGPIFGAFVEPDEKKLEKSPAKIQNAIYAAGPWSNIVSALFFFLLVIGMSIAITPALGPSGLTFDNVVEGSPAEAAGLEPGIIYTATADGELKSSTDLFYHLQNKTPGSEFSLITENKKYIFELGASPDNPEQPWIGIEGVSTAFALEKSNPWIFAIINFVQGTLYWIFVVSLGLGLANLIPLGPVDGGRIYQNLLRKFMKKKHADLIWRRTATAFLLLIIVLVFVPIIRAVISNITG